MTSPFLVWARRRSSDPRDFQPLGERLGSFLAVEQADVDPDDARQRHVEVVLPGSREPQGFLADAFELAEELLLARQVEPGIGPEQQPAPWDRLPGPNSVCSPALAVVLAACPSS